MTSQQFAFWLQGFFEISNEDTNYTGELNRKQVQMIEKHLSLVFTHENALT
jgi:neutral trehalase